MDDGPVELSTSVMSVSGHKLSLHEKFTKNLRLLASDLRR